MSRSMLCFCSVKWPPIEWGRQLTSVLLRLGWYYTDVVLCCVCGTRVYKMRLDCERPCAEGVYLCFTESRLYTLLSTDWPSSRLSPYSKPSLCVAMLTGHTRLSYIDTRISVLLNGLLIVLLFTQYSTSFLVGAVGWITMIAKQSQIVMHKCPF